MDLFLLAASVLSQTERRIISKGKLLRHVAIGGGRRACSLHNPLFSRCLCGNIEIKNQRVPNGADDPLGLLSLQFCPLISVPWPPSRSLVMRKCAVVFVYWGSLSGCSSSPCLNINRNKMISLLGVFLLSYTSLQRAEQPELCAQYDGIEAAATFKCMIAGKWAHVLVSLDEFYRTTCAPQWIWCNDLYCGDGRHCSQDLFMDGKQMCWVCLVTVSRQTRTTVFSA